MHSFPAAQSHGHALIRLLARITDTGTPAPPQSLTDRLGQWLDWRHAVPLAATLDARPSASKRPDAGIDDDEREFARVRASLVAAIEGDRAFAPGTRADTDDAASAEMTLYRQRYLTLQQIMEGETGRLRARLRKRLAAHGGSRERLAAIDAVMEQTIGVQERALLAPLPGLLATHFTRSRSAAVDAGGAMATGSPPPVGPATWRAGFHRDMKQLLLAELDIRMQPALGLLAALRTTTSEAHAP